jgi:hypothetical protein
MLEKLHEHMVDELNQSSRTDTIFILAAIVFDLIALGINSGIASSASNSYENSSNTGANLTLVIMILMTLIVNVLALLGLNTGRGTRQKLMDGLFNMYVDNQIDKYYDHALINNYQTRYWLFSAIICVLAFTSVVIPLIVRFVGS